MGFMKDVWDKTFGGDSIFGKAWDAMGMTDIWENGLQLDERLGMKNGSDDAVLGSSVSSAGEAASIKEKDDEGSSEVTSVVAENVGGEGSQSLIPDTQTNTVKKGSLVSQGQPTFGGSFGFTKTLGA